MSKPTAKVGQVGLELIVAFRSVDCLTGVEAPLAVNTSTTREICFRRPDGTTFTVAAVFTPAPCGTGTGSDGKISFTTIAGTLNQSGRWQYQGHAITPTAEFWSEEISFSVDSPIC